MTSDDIDLSAAIDALRASDPLRVDPLRWHRIEALARRADRHQGAVREQLEASLRSVVSAHRQALQALDQARPGEPGVRPARHGLRELRERLHRAAAQAFPEPAPPAEPLSATRAEPAGAWTPGGDAAGLADPQSAAQASPYELRALRRHRSTWVRLSAEQQLRRTMAQVPPQAGPLNSPHLLHRALQLMQASSPSYLQHFVSQVDALLWLERLQVSMSEASPAAASLAVDTTKKAETPKRTAAERGVAPRRGARSGRQRR